MCVKALIKDFRSSMVIIDYTVDEIADRATAEMMFRELNRASCAVVRKFKTGHSLFTKIVPDAQIPLWKDFSRQNGGEK